MQTNEAEYEIEAYEGEEDDEEMPATERELADDAPWKLIQKNTFTRWANEHLKTVNKYIADLETDLADGLRLIGLVEVLSGKKFRHINKRPNFRTQKLENVTMSLKFLEIDEGIRIVNIDSTDIVDGKLKLILGLIWTLILHYSISMPMWEGEEEGPDKVDKTPKQRLLGWIQSKIPDRPVNNFTKDWNDGRAIGALVDAVAPGLCPDWEDWDPKNAKKNAKEAMEAAEQWLDVPQLIRPEEMTNPNVDELSMMTYLSQFPNAKLKPGAPLRPRTNAGRVRAYGPGIEPSGNAVGAPARFTVETFSAGRGEVYVMILNPKGVQETCEIVFNNDRNLTYSCMYVPTMEGTYRVIVKFANKEIPKSPFEVMVEGAAGDASKVTAAGPGLERSGVQVKKKTYFEVFTKGAGSGNVDISILDPHGRRDTVKPHVTKRNDDTYLVEYTAKEQGLHSVNIFFSGTAIPNSPYGVGVSPEGGLKPGAADAKKCYATGRGIQPKGIRARDVAVFKIHTEGAGDEIPKVGIKGPGNSDEPVTVKQIDEHTYECTYVPPAPGVYTINCTYGGDHITKSPFRVDVAKYMETKIVAFGSGLEGGTVGYPAEFTVETNGETGALGFSIEGPCQAKIDCKDNGDGSADITYWPTMPGEYAVHILCNEQDIPKSPWMAEIKPATKEFDPTRVTATGPGLQKTGVTVNKWAEFTVDTRAAGKAPLDVSCMDSDYKMLDVQIKDNKDGTYFCRYMPTRNCKHTVQVNYGGCNIPKAPFRVMVAEASKPENVKVYGPGVEQGVKTFQPTFFTVDCKEAGPGDVAIALTDERGLDVPVSTKDNGDGTFRIEYEPKSVGEYTASVFFADQEIPKSPVKINVQPSIDVSKVKVDGLDDKIPLGVEKEFDIITTGAGKGEVNVTITSPTGKLVSAKVDETIDGYAAKFTLLEAGVHTVEVKFAGMPVPKSPFKVTGVAPPQAKVAPPPPPAADPSKVKAYGPGLQGGQTDRPAEFTVDTRGAGSGGLGLTIEGPSESKIECRDNGDGTCNVVYYPTEPGEYVINVTFADQHIPNSPFKAQIMPSKQINVGGVKVYGPGVDPKGVFLESTTDFTVDAVSVSPTGEGKARAVITNPSGSKMEALVKNNNDGTYKVSYTPFEQGPHKLDVSYEGIPVPHSPFTVSAVPGCDPTRVKAYGPGLQAGNTDYPQQFTVETRGAGQGGLGLAIEGPSEAKMTCKDNRDGSCSVEYLPTKPGDYDVTVKFADEHIPGSPFGVHISDEVNPNKVKAYGPGLDPKGVRSGQPAQFTVDATEAGEAPLEVTTTDQLGRRRPATVRPAGDGIHNVSYYPDTEGPCTVDVNYAGEPIPNSPFQTQILPVFDASKVRVDDIQTNNVPASLPTSFTIDTREAGIADLDIIIIDPEGQYVRPKVVDNGDGTYTVTYTPEELGQYQVKIKFGGQEVPNSPFVVNTVPTGDASKVRIEEGTEKTIIVGEDCTISVNASEAGQGKVTCRIRHASGSDVDIDIQDNGDGTFSIHYTPHSPGTYTINIKFGGQQVPNGLYDVEVAMEEDVIAAETAGTEQVEHFAQETYEAYESEVTKQFSLVDFCLPVGPIFNFVTAEVTMPSGKVAYPKIEDNQDGTVTIRYQPTEKGAHSLDVRYNREPIEGSPFKFHVESVNSGYVTAYGPGLSHGVSGEPALFSINTKHAGAGGLALAVEGPSKAEIACKDNKDGTCSVSYMPTAPGEYNVIVKFADKHIAGSPFTAKITGGDRQRAHLSVGSASEVSLKVKETDISNLTATIKSPSGREDDCILKRLANGHLGISFTPREKGEHLVSVYRSHKHISNSPFKIYVKENEIGNASKVKVSGRGLHEGVTNTANEFCVNTKEAGYGGLSLSIEGPSKADIDCKDNADGSCNVTYVPTETGTYIINVKFADEHVPGSPFIVNCTGTTAGKIKEKIIKQREAADVMSIGSQCELNLKIPGTSPFDMEAAVTSPTGVTELCDIMDLDDCTYNIKFVPKEMGVHTVSVKHKGMHIPGSPFQFTVGPLTEGGAHKVHAAGPGLEKGEINQNAEFNIYTREAGAGALSISVEGPSKADINFVDRKDGTCGVSYVVAEPGEYRVSVRLNEEPIPESPWMVDVSPSIGDARKVTIASLQEKGLSINKPVAFICHMNGAKGRLEANTVMPSQAECDTLVQMLDKEQYAVRFIPKENGVHLVHVRLDGAHIPGSPFKMLVGKSEADPGKVHAYGDGLSTGNVNQKCAFIVNTVGAGSGALCVTVDGPSKVQLNCKEIDEGYEFTYNPTMAGDYLITIKYGGPIHIAGSPFKAVIKGPGPRRAGHETSSCVVETVVKTLTEKKSNVRQFDSDASKVTTKGMGLKKAFAGRAATFTVDTRNAGQNILYVGMIGPNRPAEECHIKHAGRSNFSISYLCKERGDYMLVVKWGEEHIPDSPFTVECR